MRGTSFGHLLVIAIMAVGILTVGLAQVPASAAPAAVGLFFDGDTAQHRFAAGDVEAALEADGLTVERRNLSSLQGYDGPKVVIGLASDRRISSALAAEQGAPVGGLGEQSFALRSTTRDDARSHWVLGGDDNGAMYGALEMAENITFSGFQGTYDAEASPRIKNRGIKFNLPLDKDAPTYFSSNKGDSHQVAIEHVWDMQFWTAWFDEMARNRFNTLSLWTNNPFVSMLDMSDEGYPNVHITGVTGEDGEKINDWSIDRKVTFWQDVMAYGRDRGFDTHMITWNIFLQTAEGEHGISKRKGDRDTIDYVNAGMVKFLETYPDLAGFGVTAGEGFSNYSDTEKEDWLWRTYGKGMLAYAQDNPDRDLVFIHRQHQTGADDVLDFFAPLNDLDNVRLDMSFKYSKAHLYAAATPTYIGGPNGNYRRQLRSNGVKTWLELRNDSFHYLQWADPQFARAYVNGVPAPVGDSQDVDDITVGVFMGPDGWVKTREFTSTNPFYERQRNGQGALNIEKNWYMNKLWGRLLFDPETPDEVFTNHLANRFPGVDATGLFDAWSSASRSVQIANEQLTSGGWNLDFQWWPEAWTAKETEGGWKSVDDVRDSEPMQGSRRCSIEDSADDDCDAGQVSAAVTAAEIERLASGALATIDGIDPGADTELMLNLGDVEALAHLGLFNASKFRAALALEEGNRGAAADAMAAGYCHWLDYSTTMDSLYEGAQTQRNINLTSWRALNADALQDFRDAGGSGTPTCDGDDPRDDPEDLETLPWVEDFGMADGTIVDDGPTSWQASRDRGSFDVRSDELVLNDRGTEGVLSTGIIDISGQPVDISLGLSSQGRLEDDPSGDYVRLYIRIDGGPEQLVGERRGIQPATTITADGVTGDTLQLVIRGSVSYRTEYYFMDNLSVMAAP